MTDTPALNIPIRATGLDTFKSQMNETSIMAANAARTVTATTIKMSAGFLASQGAAGAATLAFGKLLGFLRPIALGVTAVADTYLFLRSAVQLAGQQIEAFNAIAAKAGSAGVSTDFFQRFTKSAPNAALSIDQVTEALQNFNKASTEHIGGSDLQQRIDEYRKAGGLAGNSGVSQFAGSSNTEARLRAIVSLIDQAWQKGEELAALDIAGKAFGAPVEAALRADSGYLDEMLKKADSMSKAQIVSQDDIGRAIELKSQIEAAQQILADKWKPIQNDMASLGMNARANWASVVTVLADMVGLADKLYATLKEIPDVFASIGGSSIWTRLTELSGRLGLNSTPESMGLETGIDVQRQDATNRLRTAMRNPDNVRRAMQETSNVQSGVRGDTSKNPNAQSSDQGNKVDHAIDNLRKQTQEREAETKAIGLGDAALAKLKAQAAETAAVQANGGKETAKQAAQFKELQQRASDAADALAKAKVNSDISFNRQTAFLTPEDAQIASKLKGIYGDDIPKALGSSEAAAIRLNDTLKSVGDAFSSSITNPLLNLESGTTRASTAFTQFGQQFVRTLLQMVNQALIVKPLLSGIGGLFGMTGLGGSAGTGSIPVMSSPGDLGGGTGGMSFPMFGSGTDSAPGGLAWVGERGPELVNLPKGSQVIPNHISMKLAQNIPGYADGGVIGGGKPAPLFGGSSSHVSFGDIHLNGAPQGNSPAQNHEYAKQMARQFESTVRGMIGDELRTQTRPGGVLAGR